MEVHESFPIHRGIRARKLRVAARLPGVSAQESACRRADFAGAAAGRGCRPLGRTVPFRLRARCLYCFLLSCFSGGAVVAST